jgi:hypothetical protein
MTDTTDTTTEAGALPADFAGLAAQADMIEGAAAPPPAGEAEADPADTAQELFEALAMLRDMAAPTVAWWREYRTVWSDRALRAIAESGAVVMQRHGLTLGEVWTHLGPYIALVAAALPPSLATWQAIRNRDALPEGPPQ